MLDNSEDVKGKNSQLTGLLIFINFILLVFYLNCTYNDSHDSSSDREFFAFAVTFLLAGFIITYRGKRYRVALVLFVLSLLISLFIAFVNSLAYAMAQGFSH
jgi:energy-coupling factor transporter transmembrane protein EcfT